MNHTRALLQMLVESDVAATVLEAEARLGKLNHADQYADEIRLDRWRKLGRRSRTPSEQLANAPFHIPDERKRP